MTENDRYWQVAKMARAEAARGRLGTIPFVDFVLVAGSVAMGNPTADSDIDVILGCRAGRIWTVRLFAIAILELAGLRRRAGDSKTDARDRLCLSHFLTPESYRLMPPYNEYWETLYRRLVPFAGDTGIIGAFFAANAAWRKGEPESTYHTLPLGNWLRKFFEWLLSGWLGNRFESFARMLQKRRIERNLPGPETKPRIRFDDAELEFHPDTLRTETYFTTHV